MHGLCTCLWYIMITGCLVQVGAWLMHFFMVQVDYRLRYRLMHGSGYWYMLFGAG
jgi:hypothetical protein